MCILCGEPSLEGSPVVKEGQVSEEAVSHHPAHPLGYEADHWLCPRPVCYIPKRLTANLKWRQDILSGANGDPEAQKALLEACAASPLFFLNAFAWTYRPRYTCEDGYVRGAGSKWIDDSGQIRIVPTHDAPVITWPAQDVMVAEIQRVFDGGTLIIDKSREQGATVIVMYMLAWGLLFKDRFSALVISRKAAMVDSHAEDSLFGKVDYLTNRIPTWMLPEGAIQRLHGDNPFIQNSIRKSRLIGETSNKDVGQSLRTTVTFVDEAARFPEGRELRKSIETVSAGYIYASTPDGPGTEFSKLRERAMGSGGSKNFRLVTLGYWDHPQMGRARKLIRDMEGHVTGSAGSYFWDTPAFKIARAESTSDRELRENWLIDHDTSGMCVLDSNTMAKLRRMSKRPRDKCSVDVKRKILVSDRQGRLSVWCKLDKWGNPPSDTNYVMGIDVAYGVERSNTVMAVMDRTSMQIVAEYVDPSIKPYEAARVADVLGSIFGGQRGHAFIIPEYTGPGIGFSHELVRVIGYPHVYYKRLEDRRTAKKTRRYGWHATAANKEILFKDLDKVLKNGEFWTPSKEGVEDMAMWIYDDNGRIVCGSMRDFSSGAQARHGDRAVAYGLCVIGYKEVPLFEPSKPFYRDGTLGNLFGHDVLDPQPVGGLIDPFA